MLSPSYRREQFQCRVDGSVAVLRFTARIAEILGDLQVKESLFEVLAAADSAAETRAILILPGIDALSDGVVGQLERELSEDTYSSGEERLCRIENAASQLILWASKCRTPTVIGLQGEVSGPFLGLALSCDCRLAEVSSVIRFTHAAGGALGYLLPRYVGIGKATELALGGGALNAMEARDLGLVSEVAARLEFERACLEKAGVFARRPADHSAAVKELLEPHWDGELARYLSAEGAVMRRTLYQDRRADAGHGAPGASREMPGNVTQRRLKGWLGL